MEKPMFQMFSFDKTTRPMPEPDFHGAALIDDEGREIPITEEMVLDACEALEKHWHYPVMTGHSTHQRRVC